MISIRPYRHGDEAALYEAVDSSREDLAPFMPWCHAGYAPSDTKQWIETQVIAFAEKREFDFVIESETGEFLGACGLNQLDPMHRRANLGYWVRSSARGRGIAVQAVELLAAWAFANTELIRLEIVVSVENAASLRVAEKAGAEREGVLRSRIYIHDTPHDAVVFSLIRPATQRQ